MLSPSATGQGVGKSLASTLISDIGKRNETLVESFSPLHHDPGYRDGEITNLLAIVAMEQNEDVGEGTRAARFYEREGFRRVGVMEAVGKKFGRRVDVGVLQSIV